MMFLKCISPEQLLKYSHKLKIKCVVFQSKYYLKILQLYLFWKSY